MTLTSLDAISYAKPEAETPAVPASVPVERIPLSALPKLIWVAGALLTVNLIVGVGMLITPNLELDPFGREVRSSEYSSSRLSPFTETIDTTRRKVRVAAKLTPVTFVPAPEQEFLASSSTPLELNGLLKATELERDIDTSRQLDLPRSSRVNLQLDMPVRTESALYRPSEKASEREKRFVVIN